MIYHSPVLRRASGKLFNLSIRSQLGSCITHHCGKLSVEQVAMECDTEGLDHLVSPMATLAVSPGATPCSGHLALPHAHPARKRKSEMEEGGRMLAGPGVLSVVESKIKVRRAGFLCFLHPVPVFLPALGRRTHAEAHMRCRAA